MVAVAAAFICAPQLFSFSALSDSEIVKAPKYPAGVPAAITDLHVEDVGTQTSSVITFTMPSATFAGTPLSADEQGRYTLEVNGKTVKENVSAYWGDEINVAIAVASGLRGENFDIKVWASNDDGDGPNAEISYYLGEDTASPVSDFTFTHTDSAFEVSWAPASGIHGGNFDTNVAKYHLYAFPGKRKIADLGYTATSYSVPIDGELLPGEYYFGIEMEYWNVEDWKNDQYPMAYSTREFINPISDLPYTFSLKGNQVDASKMFGTEECNDRDNTETWTFTAQGATIGCDQFDPKNDWLYTMPFSLSKDCLYRFTVKAKDSGFTEKFEVKAGAMGTSSAMDIDVIPEVVLDNGASTSFSGEFTPNSDGPCILGIHATSDVNMYMLYVEEISLECIANLNAPAAPTEMRATAWYFDETPSVKVTMRAPATDNGGRPLESLSRLVICRDGEQVYETQEVTPGAPVSFTDPTGLGTFTYSAKAYSAGYEGAEGAAEAMVTEVKVPDFEYNIGGENLENTKSTFAIFDSNGDGHTWQFGSSTASIVYNTDNGHDDWLITMPIALQAGIIYDFMTSVWGSGYPEAIEMWLGTAPTPEAMNVKILDREIVEETSATEKLASFESHRRQVVYLGIRACSDADQHTLYLNKIGVKATGTCQAIDYARDLSAKELVIKSDGVAGDPLDVELCVANTGAETMPQFTAVLYAGENEVARTQGPSLASDTETMVKFTYPSTLFDTTVTLWAEVICEGDEYADNNTTDEYEVQFGESGHPKVTDLTAEVNEGIVTLRWQAPDLSGTGCETVTESFEDYVSFATMMEDSPVEGDLGDWTVIDNDGLPEYWISSIGSFPGYVNVSTYLSPRAWMVYNRDEAEGVSSGYRDILAAASGQKMLLALAGVPSGTQRNNDDWLISPELSGNAQTISFKAKSPEGYTEKFQVLYSTGSMETADFELVAERTVAVQESFQEFSFQLPAGAKRFAIRYISPDLYGMFVDDIVYERGGGDEGLLEIQGYNIWRDGVKLNQSPVQETEYQDNPATAQGAGSALNKPLRANTRDVIYHVNALYDRGQSGLSEPVTVKVENIGTGINLTGTDQTNVTALRGLITVSGASGLTVSLYSLDGILLESIQAEGTVEFRVAAGNYIVRTPVSVTKVTVK